jgi:hypothetical protein
MLVAVFPAAHPGAEPTPVYSFDDRATAYDGGHPPWFAQSFLYLDEALVKGKSGFLVYFGKPPPLAVDSSRLCRSGVLRGVGDDLPPVSQTGRRSSCEIGKASPT